MSNQEDRVHSLITADAVDWFVASREGLDSHQREGFANWLRSSPIHVGEYLGVAGVARDLRAACADLNPSLEALIARARSEQEPISSKLGLARQRPRQGHWRRFAAAFAALATAAVGLWVWQAPHRTRAPGTAKVLHVQTRHGEQARELLADGTILHLNTDTAVMVQYDARERLVTIGRGQVMFEVKHDSLRQFRVLTSAAQVVAVGTKFDVYVKQGATVVTVIEGQVAVGTSSLEQPEVTLPRFVRVHAGQQSRIAAGEEPTQPLAVNPGSVTAWLRRQIVFEHEPLGVVSAEFNRYATTPIEIDGAALQGLPITGVFAADDTEAFIAFLRSLEGVQVEVSAGKIRVSHPPEKTNR